MPWLTELDLAMREHRPAAVVVVSLGLYCTPDFVWRLVVPMRFSLEPRATDEGLRFCFRDIEAGRPTKRYELHPQIQHNPSAASSVAAISAEGRAQVTFGGGAEAADHCCA